MVLVWLAMFSGRKTVLPEGLFGGKEYGKEEATGALTLKKKTKDFTNKNMHT